MDVPVTSPALWCPQKQGKKTCNGAEQLMEQEVKERQGQLNCFYQLG